LSLGETELGEHVLQRVDGSGLAAVILVPVHVEDLLPGNGKHATDDTFLKKKIM
jgi:hypothetical protein